MFELTAAAAEQVRIAANQGGTEGMALRLAARKRDDGSIDYLMGFDEIKEEDVKIKTQEVDIVIAPEYVGLLNDTVMDFVEMEDGEQRFIFLNPQDANYSPPTES